LRCQFSFFEPSLDFLVHFPHLNPENVAQNDAVFAKRFAIEAVWLQAVAQPGGFVEQLQQLHF